VPADAEIVEGEAELDESMITGEAKPGPKGVDEKVVASMVVYDSSIRIRATVVGEETTLAGIRRLVQEAQGTSLRARVAILRSAQRENQPCKEGYLSTVTEEARRYVHTVGAGARLPEGLVFWTRRKPVGAASRPWP
jgi:hypothetical protein